MSALSPRLPACAVYREWVRTRIPLLPVAVMSTKSTRSRGKGGACKQVLGLLAGEAHSAAAAVLTGCRHFRFQLRDMLTNFVYMLLQVLEGRGRLSDDAIFAFTDPFAVAAHLILLRLRPVHLHAWFTPAAGAGGARVAAGRQHAQLHRLAALRPGALCAAEGPRLLQGTVAALGRSSAEKFGPSCCAAPCSRSVLRWMGFTMYLSEIVLVSCLA